MARPVHRLTTDVDPLLVANATIVDGTGAPAVGGSVLVMGDRIARILGPHEAEPDVSRRFDARGHVVAPGFVDVHQHSDMTPFVEPSMESMLRQGVTTVVVGNCGASAFPFHGAEELAALVGTGVEALAPGWSTFDGYLERIQACRPALNVAALVGHGTLRQAALGPQQRRRPGSAEMSEMQRLLGEALEQGALGLSSGLIYDPGIHAETDELAELASTLVPYGGIYASHIRDEGASVFDAVAECLEVGRRAGVPAHVSHLKVESSRMWGKAGDLLELLDRARERGVDVTADQYPYTAWETELAAALPAWTSPGELPTVLADASLRERLRAAMEDGEPGWQGLGGTLGWERVVIGSHNADPKLTGRSVADLAEERGIEPFEVVTQLLLADPSTSMIGHGMHEDDVRRIAALPDVLVASDGLAVSPEGPLGRMRVHPRYYGTFPRILGRYVRREGLLSIENAVAKMTSLPAERFGLTGRGRLVEGALADLVVFDASAVEDAATFERPHAFAEGIELVVVNGQIAWDGATGTPAGRALRRGQR